MTEVHTDGNGIAGLLSEVFAVEVTTVQRRCQSCGAESALGDHRAYRGAGVVLRCPACADVAMRIGVAEDRLVLECRGTFTAPRPS